MSEATRWKDPSDGALKMAAEITSADLDRMEFTQVERANIDRGFAEGAPASAWLLSFSIMFRVLERTAPRRGA